MVKKSALLFMLAIFIIAIAGCETAKGAIGGAKLDLQTAHRGAIKSWQALMATDDWIRRNLW